MKKLIALLFSLSLGVTLFLFVAGPSRKLMSYLPSEKAAKFFPLLVFLGAVATFLLYCWKKILEAKDSRGHEDLLRPSLPSRKPSWFLALQLILSGILFGQTLSQINVPLDWDEHEHVTLIAGAAVGRALNPFYGSENHVVASLAAYVSMKVFGVNKFAARLPALIFGLFFLLALNVLVYRHLEMRVGGALLTVLAANQMIVYTLHQMRGYAPLLGATLAILVVCLSLVFERKRADKKTLAALGALSLLALFSHTFGGLFLGLLFTSLLVYGYLKRQILPRHTLDNIHRIGLLLCGILLFYAVLSVFIILHLQETGFAARSEEIPGWLRTLMIYRPFTLFGLVRSWELKLFGVFAALALVGNLSTRNASPSPLGLVNAFVLATAIFILAMGILLRFTVLEGRMLQVFAVLFLWWALVGVAQLFSRESMKSTVLTGLAILLVLPWALHRDKDDGVPQFFAEVERFAEGVKAVSVDEPRACYSFSGDPSTVGYMEHFYFHNERKTESETDCPVRLHLFFERGLFDRRFGMSENHKDSTLLFTDGNGRFLFRLADLHRSLSQGR